GAYAFAAAVFILSNNKSTTRDLFVMTTDYCTSLRPLDAASRGLNNSRRYRSINKTDLNSYMSCVPELLRDVDVMSRDLNKVLTLLKTLSRYGTVALRSG